MTSRCCCQWLRWWGRWCTFRLLVGRVLCFFNVTFSDVTEGAEELQDIWVVKTTWGGRKGDEDDWNKQVWPVGTTISTRSVVFLSVWTWAEGGNKTHHWWSRRTPAVFLASPLVPRTREPAGSSPVGQTLWPAGLLGCSGSHTPAKEVQIFPKELHHP